MYVLRLNVVYRRFCPFLIRKIVLVENFGKKMITNQHKTRHFVLVCDHFLAIFSIFQPQLSRPKKISGNQTTK